MGNVPPCLSFCHLCAVDKKTNCDICASWNPIGKKGYLLFNLKKILVLRMHNSIYPANTTPLMILKLLPFGEKNSVVFFPHFTFIH
jgi:hypothetical protein